MRSARKLDRLLRVRTLQLGLVQGHEAQAVAKVSQEQTLKRRIENLAANVAPAPQSMSATGLLAAAHYRERLHQSAHAAVQRVANAERGLDAARDATREARRDQSAIEKLIEREKGIALRREMRALEDLPPSARKRHDLC